jgi:hypothetical protein
VELGEDASSSLALAGSRPLFGVWLLLVVVLALAVAFAVNATLPQESKLFGLAPWVSVGISLGLIPLLEVVLRQVVGDAARYLNPAPSNNQVRQRIRSAGVTLLQKLHERGYERIVIVGHSLGSVIGYDVLTHAWAQYYRAHETRDPAHTALEDLEEAARGDDAEAYRKKQAQYAVELQRNGNPWRVTDFVTLGSPLAHAAVLLARNSKDLKQRQADRELPTCPPVLETQKQDGDKIQRFSFPLSWEDPYGHSKQIRVPHHAAVFGPVRWTNLYFPAYFVIWGDVISGPVAPAFGVGVEDIPVSTRIRAGFISHTLYWKLPPCQRTAPHVEKLRRAVRLAE